MPYTSRGVQTTTGICAMCGEERQVNTFGFCEWEELDTENTVPNTFLNLGCVNVANHIWIGLKRRGSAKLRTKNRTVEEARRMIGVVAAKRGIDVQFSQVGDRVIGTAVGQIDAAAAELRRAPRKIVEGFVLDELDAARLEVMAVEQRRMVGLLEQMAAMDELSVQRLPEERDKLGTLERLVEEKRRERRQAS